MCIASDTSGLQTTADAYLQRRASKVTQIDGQQTTTFGKSLLDKLTIVVDQEQNDQPDEQDPVKEETVITMKYQDFLRRHAMESHQKVLHGSGKYIKNSDQANKLKRATGHQKFLKMMTIEEEASFLSAPHVAGDTATNNTSANTASKGETCRLHETTAATRHQISLCKQATLAESAPGKLHDLTADTRHRIEVQQTRRLIEQSLKKAVVEESSAPGHHSKGTNTDVNLLTSDGDSRLVHVPSLDFIVQL